MGPSISDPFVVPATSQKPNEFRDDSAAQRERLTGSGCRAGAVFDDPSDYAADPRGNCPTLELFLAGVAAQKTARIRSAMPLGICAAPGAANGTCRL